MGEACAPDELRTLFLFEDLTDDQLQTLCARTAHIGPLEPGPICQGDRPPVSTCCSTARW